MTSAHMAKKIIRVSRYGLPCTTLRLTIQRAIYVSDTGGADDVGKGEEEEQQQDSGIAEAIPQDGGYGGVAAQAQEKQAKMLGQKESLAISQP